MMRAMPIKIRRPSDGAIAVAALVWVPAWLVGARVVGGTTASTIGLTMAVAPFLMALLWLCAMLVIVIRKPEHFAFAVVFGVPAVLWLLGAQLGMAAIGASVLLWVASRAVRAALERRKVTRPVPAATYTGGLLIEPRRPPQDRQEPR